MYPSSCDGCSTNRDFSIHLRDNVKIYGGFFGNESAINQRNFGQYQTILSGDIGQINDNTDNVYNVVTSISDSNATRLDGFIIKHGRANLNSNDKVIETYNVSKSTGGGMMNINSNAEIANCVFANNYAEIGGGLYNYISNIKANNLVFVENGSIYGGGIFNGTNSFCNFQNITVYNNVATGIGGGIFNQYNANIILSNSIVVSSINANIFNDSASPIVSYSIIEGGYAGTGNININPKFLNSTNLIGNDNKWMTADDGLNISQCSPAVDSGLTNSNSPITDIANNVRIDVLDYGTDIIDIGAYENQLQSTPFPTVPSPQNYSTGDTLASLNATGQNLKWYTTFESMTPIPTNTVLTNGSYYVTQTINGCESERLEVVVTVTLSNSENEFNSKVIVYPNPFANEISIQIDSDALVEIVDVLGKKILSKKINNGLNTLDSSILPSGMYFTKITNQQNQTKTVKLIKK